MDRFPSPNDLGSVLPPRLKSEVKRELQRLELVVEMIAILEAERNAIVEDEASTHINAKKIHNLHKLKAIGARPQALRLRRTALRLRGLTARLNP